MSSNKKYMSGNDKREKKAKDREIDSVSRRGSFQVFFQLVNKLRLQVQMIIFKMKNMQT